MPAGMDGCFRHEENYDILSLNSGSFFLQTIQTNFIMFISHTLFLYLTILKLRVYIMHAIVGKKSKNCKM